MTFKAPYLPYDRVGGFVEDFLDKHHPDRSIPVPIEWIIESNLGIDIVPVPFLYRTFRNSGFLTADRKSIYIDEYQYDNFIEKYRFTLAHEVGHLIMHESIYEGISFTSIQEYIEFMDSIQNDDFYWFETQAEWFAEQLLVPASKLEESCVDLLEANRSRFSKFEYLPIDFWSYAANEISDIFDVNSPVIENRIRHLSFSDKYSTYYRDEKN
jgi:Zn-dependent peptidase ImmA (M78 family)